MKNLKFLGLCFLSLLIASCSSDDTSDTTGLNENGFTYNGEFFSTEFARSNDQNSSYNLVFTSHQNTSNPDGHFGRFHLNSGTMIEDGPLIEGRYSSNNGANSRFGIDGYDPVQFQQNNNKDEVHISTSAWAQDDRFKSAQATINSITSTENNIVTQIDIDYRFEWDGVVIIGSYSGPVFQD